MKMVALKIEELQIVAAGKEFLGRADRVGEVEGGVDIGAVDLQIVDLEAEEDTC